MCHIAVVQRPSQQHLAQGLTSPTEQNSVFVGVSALLHVQTHRLLKIGHNAAGYI